MNTNYHIRHQGINSVGTVSFDLKAPGHRGYQDFIVYPINEQTKIIHIQSDKRWGEYNPKTGQITLSKSRARQGNSYCFEVDKYNGDLKVIQLTEKDNDHLSYAIRKTAGIKTNSILVVDNSHADKI